MKLTSMEGEELASVSRTQPSESGDSIDVWIRPGTLVVPRTRYLLHNDDGTTTEIEVISVFLGNDGLAGPQDLYGRPPKPQQARVVAGVIGVVTSMPPRGSPIPQR
jgi:hypothetical protein